jgi:mono/diheme cytochrome c family protein
MTAITAVTVYQATLPVPGRVIADDPEVEQAVHIGEQRFSQLGCASCHIPRLPLVDKGWFYTKPNPFHPAVNLRVGDAQTPVVDLTSEDLPG